jgi:hypothetical protein
MLEVLSIDAVCAYSELSREGRTSNLVGQGEVHKVVDIYNDNHHAYKIVAVKTEESGLPNINSLDVSSEIPPPLSRATRCTCYSGSLMPRL